MSETTTIDEGLLDSVLDVSGEMLPARLKSAQGDIQGEASADLNKNANAKGKTREASPRELYGHFVEIFRKQLSAAN